MKYIQNTIITLGGKHTGGEGAEKLSSQMNQTKKTHLEVLQRCASEFHHQYWLCPGEPVQALQFLFQTLILMTHPTLIKAAIISHLN